MTLTPSLNVSRIGSEPRETTAPTRTTIPTPNFITRLPMAHLRIRDALEVNCSTPLRGPTRTQRRDGRRDGAITTSPALDLYRLEGLWRCSLTPGPDGAALR